MQATTNTQESLELTPKSALVAVLPAFVASRLLLMLASWVGMRVDPGLREAFGPHALFAGTPAFDAFCRWDCEWYLAVARTGYANGPQTNFFPLLPMLTHAFSFVTRIPEHWGIILVANLASLASYVVLYRMFARLAGIEVARWALVLFVAYPFAFFHSTGYPESLMVLLSAWSIDLALRGKHWAAGLALAVGSWSRHLTLLAGFGLVTAQWQQRPSVKKFLLSPALLSLALPPLGLVAYCTYQKVAWGNFLAFYEARKLWGELAYYGLVDHLRPGNQLNIYKVLISTYLPFAAVAAAGLVPLLKRKVAWAPLAFGLVLTALIWSVGLWGLGRYSASCWPAFLGLGIVAQKYPAVGALLLAGFGAFQGVFFLLFMHQWPVL